MAAEAGHRGSQNCLRQGLSFPGAHILVAVGRRLEMALPGQLMLEGGVGAERETLPHPHPVCQDAYCDEGGGRQGFLPVVPFLPSLPGCKTVPPHPQQSLSPHLGSSLFVWQHRLLLSLLS